MEFIEGHPLKELIPLGGLPPALVVRYGTQISAALAHAHGHNIIHRDVKTSNVVITPTGHALVLDFGLAKHGHIHGGQLSLEYFHRGLCLARVESPYVSGWYEKSGGQLYVNRGIGTTMFPIRLGPPPEITVLELSKT
jgi:predicted MPP superfamily phosphohydrolase